MRGLLFIIFLILLGILIYTEFIQPTTEDQKAVKALRREFDLAVNQYIRALKYTSGVGMDMIGDMEMAVARIRKVKKELQEIKSTLQDEVAKEKAASLEEKIKNFMKKNDLD